jgi:hypothetical protein
MDLVLSIYFLDSPFKSILLAIITGQNTKVIESRSVLVLLD